MKWFPFVALSLLSSALPSVGMAAEREDGPSRGLKFNPWTGEGFSLGGVLFPEFHAQTAWGSSSADPATLAAGRHDPERQGVTLQSAGVALAAKLGERVRLFGEYTAKLDSENRWRDEFDEYFVEVSDLPLGIRLKAGRFYTAFGYDNGEDPRNYTFVDKFLATGRLLGEDSVSIYGGEISLPGLARGGNPRWSDRLAFSYGNVPEESELLRPRPDEKEAPYEGDRARWQDGLATVDYTVTFTPREAVSFAAGLSAAWGHNGLDRETEVFGAHGQFLWRPAGASAGRDTERRETGEFFRWRTEVFVRHFGAAGVGEEAVETTRTIAGVPATYHQERQIAGVRFGPIPGAFTPIFRFHRVLTTPAIPPRKVTTRTIGERPARDEFTDAGFYTALTYGFPGGKVQAHLRAEYVSGLAEAGLLERYRLSPAVTWIPSAPLPFDFKVQYNYDHFPAHGDEHSVWAQFSIFWGRAEARDR